MQSLLLHQTFVFGCSVQVIVKVFQCERISNYNIPQAVCPGFGTLALPSHDSSQLIASPCAGFISFPGHKLQNPNVPKYPAAHSTKITEMKLNRYSSLFSCCTPVNLPTIYLPQAVWSLFDTLPSPVQSTQGFIISWHGLDLVTRAHHTDISFVSIEDTVIVNCMDSTCYRQKKGLSVVHCLTNGVEFRFKNTQCINCVAFKIVRLVIISSSVGVSELCSEVVRVKCEASRIETFIHS